MLPVSPVSTPALCGFHHSPFRVPVARGTAGFQADSGPERAAAGVPDVVEVGLMIDSNTVKSEAESLLRSVRFLP